MNPTISTGLRYLGPALILASAVCVGLASTMSNALATRSVPDSVKVACSGDYKRFCNSYKVGTTKLDQCMRANGKQLSSVCVRALVDNGMVPRSLLKKARQRY
jgi:hypothetical protein